jgi:hypothetical protein
MNNPIYWIYRDLDILFKYFISFQFLKKCKMQFSMHYYYYLYMGAYLIDQGWIIKVLSMDFLNEIMDET